jgi:SRSO17 transposase
MFCGMITHLFATTKKRAENNAQHARTYIHGLLSETPRKNAEAIADAAGNTESQDLQNFLADSQWEETEVFRYAAQRANERLGNHPDAMLALDESCFSKKGEHSACVTRQYNGRLGKIDNCQVGVFSTLTNGANAVLIGARLLIPNDWVKDKQRCLAAGIPEARIKAATKIDLVRELIEEADAFGAIYARVGVDSFYGRDTGLLCWMDERGTEFYADTPASTYIWLTQPESGKHPARPGQHGAIKVSAIPDLCGGWKKSKRVRIREGENGPVMVESIVRRVWVWSPEETTARQWWLLISRDQGGTIKYTLSNAPAATPQAALAKHQGQRHFIERNFQNSKSHLGMADYQVRKWRAWHRHMAMVALAGLFVMEERLYQKPSDALLSTRDVVQILDWYFRSSPTLESVVEQIEQRHYRRRRASESKFKIAAENDKKIRKKILTV